MQLRVARPGKNALTATNPNDFIFHSDYNTLKILTEGVLSSQNVNASPKTFSVAHGTGIIPICFAFALFPDGKVSLPFASDYSDNQQRFSVEVDNTNVYFIFTKPGSDYTVSIKYFVFEAPL